MIENLEQNLQEYCRTQNSDLFGEHLYEFFQIAAAHQCNKLNIKNNVEDVIADVVGYASIQLPLKYNSSEGKAKSFLFKIMANYLNNKIRDENRDKRDVKMLIYLEDLKHYEDEEYGITHMFEITVNNIQELKSILLSNKPLFNKIKVRKQKKIKDAILKCIENPETFEEAYGSYVKDIAKKTKSKISDVYYVVNKMNEIVSVI